MENKNDELEIDLLGLLLYLKKSCLMERIFSKEALDHCGSSGAVRDRRLCGE